MGANRDEPTDVEYPSTLRVEVASTADMFDDAVAFAEAFETESGTTESTDSVGYDLRQY